VCVFFLKRITCFFKKKKTVKKNNFFDGEYSASYNKLNKTKFKKYIFMYVFSPIQIKNKMVSSSGCA